MREFLNKIKIQQCQKIVSLNEIAKEIHLNNENPLIFEIKEFNFPIVAGLIGSRDLFAMALGINKEDIIRYIPDKENQLKDYAIIKQAKFLENQVDVDDTTKLDKLIPLINFYGGKQYTTSSIVVVNYPGENRLNASFHRMMYLGGNKFAIRIVSQRHLDYAYNDAMNNKKDLNVAIVFGVHPAIEISAAYSSPRLDEFKLAASFLDGLNMFRLSNNILVPADAEFVMEGRITKDLVSEGPFIDLTGTLDIIRQQPILKVNKLYFKKDPIFRTILPGGREHRNLMGIPQEPRIYKGILNTISTVRNVVLTPGGNSWLHAVVQIKKRTEGDAKNTILAALASHPSLKRVVVVDEDIDITNCEDVEWAISTRVQPDKSIVLIPNAKGSSLDPSARNEITCKWGIDATKPLNQEGFTKVKY